MTSRARPGISKGLLAQLIALVRADEAGSVGDETEMVDLGGIAAAAVAIEPQSRFLGSGGCYLMRNRFPGIAESNRRASKSLSFLTGDRKFESISLQRRVRREPWLEQSRQDLLPPARPPIRQDRVGNLAFSSCRFVLAVDNSKVTPVKNALIGAVNPARHTSNGLSTPNAPFCLAIYSLVIMHLRR
jgi:hypothetical protein